MTDSRGRERSETRIIKDDLDDLRREVRDIHDSIALRTQKTASQQAIQTTLAIVSLFIVMIAVLFAYLASQGVTSLKRTQDSLLSQLEKDSDDLAKKYANAVVELKTVKQTRESLARKLASTKLQLDEIKLELQSGRLAGDRELSETRRKYTALQEKCSMLEREINRSDALSQQIQAIKQESASKLADCLKTIDLLERQIQRLKSHQFTSAPSSSPLGGTIFPKAKTTKPSPKPKRSKTTDDIKKDKERALDDL